jgi:hypothetical protein
VVLDGTICLVRRRIRQPARSFVCSLRLDIPERQHHEDRSLHASLPLLTACWNASDVAKLLHKEELGEPGEILTNTDVWNMVYTPVANAPWLIGLWDTYCRIGRPQLDRLGGP